MSKLSLLLSGVVITIASLAIFTNINLIWILADFLLTGQLPYFERSIGLIGSVVVLGVLAIMIGRVFYDTKSDLYAAVVENNKINAKLPEATDIDLIAELRKEDEETPGSDKISEEELEEAVPA